MLMNSLREHARKQRDPVIPYQRRLSAVRRYGAAPHGQTGEISASTRVTPRPYFLRAIPSKVIVEWILRARSGHGPMTTALPPTGIIAECAESPSRARHSAS